MVFLVDDIWMIIVWMVCAEQDPTSRAFTDTARRIALISKQLFSVVAAMPTLWANIIVDRKSTPAYVNRYLENCRTRLLGVTMLHESVRSHGYRRRFRDDAEMEGHNTVMAAFSKAASRTAKWRSLRVVTTVPNTMLAVHASLSGKPFPSLTHLSLIFEPCPLLRPIAGWVSGSASSISHLELVGVPTPWAHIQTLVGLEHLSVRQPLLAERSYVNCSADHWPSWKQLRNLLHGAHSLQILELEGIGILEYSEAGEIADESTSISTLTTLVLTHVHRLSSMSLRRFMDQWQFPKLTKLHMWFVNWQVANHWANSGLFLGPPHVGVGGRMDPFVPFFTILHSIKNVVVMDLREGPSLLGNFAGMPSAVCPKLKELWVRGSICEARCALETDFAPVLETLIFESKTPLVDTRSVQERSMIKKLVPSFIERDYSDTPRKGHRFIAIFIEAKPDLNMETWNKGLDSVARAPALKDGRFLSQSIRLPCIHTRKVTGRRRLIKQQPSRCGGLDIDAAQLYVHDSYQHRAPSAISTAANGDTETSRFSPHINHILGGTSMPISSILRRDYPMVLDADDHLDRFPYSPSAPNYGGPLSTTHPIPRIRTIHAARSTLPRMHDRHRRKVKVTHRTISVASTSSAPSPTRNMPSAPKGVITSCPAAPAAIDLALARNARIMRNLLSRYGQRRQEPPITPDNLWLAARPMNYDSAYPDRSATGVSYPSEGLRFPLRIFGYGSVRRDATSVHFYVSVPGNSADVWGLDLYHSLATIWTAT
ncbi:hypothetical protein C8R47DRAFT_1083528 [Mycena vitilis]|nr:hypothetical protein C8R47DRAFT_1083528 [Mycena vitilis]